MTTRPYHVPMPISERERYRRTKGCSRCGETKTLAEFCWNKRRGAWAAWCLRCVNYSRGEKCEECDADVSNIGASAARKAGRPVRCRTHSDAVHRRGTQAEHGSISRYGYGCRCDACRAAEAAYRREYRRRDHIVTAHGTRSAYTIGCRCDACRRANTDYNRRRRKAAR